MPYDKAALYLVLQLLMFLLFIYNMGMCAQWHRQAIKDRRDAEDQRVENAGALFRKITQNAHSTYCCKIFNKRSGLNIAWSLMIADTAAGCYAIYELHSHEQKNNDETAYFPPRVKTWYAFTYIALRILIAFVFNVLHCKFMVFEMHEDYQSRRYAVYAFIEYIVGHVICIFYFLVGYYGIGEY